MISTGEIYDPRCRSSLPRFCRNSSPCHAKSGTTGTNVIFSNKINAQPCAVKVNSWHKPCSTEQKRHQAARGRVKKGLRQRELVSGTGFASNWSRDSAAYGRAALVRCRDLVIARQKKAPSRDGANVVSVMWACVTERRPGLRPRQPCEASRL